MHTPTRTKTITFSVDEFKAYLRREQCWSFFHGLIIGALVLGVGLWITKGLWMGS